MAQLVDQLVAQLVDPLVDQWEDQSGTSGLLSTNFKFFKQL